MLVTLRVEPAARRHLQLYLVAYPTPSEEHNQHYNIIKFLQCDENFSWP